MDSTGVGLLAEGSATHLIEIRVIRKWRPRPKSQDTFYIFVDGQNDAIQAFCASKDQFVVDAKLHVSRCYHIKGYACTAVERANKVIANHVCVRMGPATSITSIDEIPAIPKNYFSFGDYNDIRDMNTSRERITDYIGVLESIEEGKTKRKSKAFVNLKITDASNEAVYITLWEEIANLFERFPRTTIERAKKPTVIAATSLRFNKYTARLDLQSTIATHVYLNPDHPAKEELLKVYNPSLVQENKELNLYATNAERLTVTELLMKEHPLPPEKTFMCEAFISEFLTNSGWYYTGCVKCKGTAHKSGDFWFCTDCGDIKDITYKSRIIVQISDGQSQLKVTMFDDTLTLLLNKPLHDIIAEDGYDDNTCLPEPITKFCGESRLFVVTPQREQYTNTPKFIMKQVLDLDFFTKPLAIEAPVLETPPPNTQPDEISNTPDTKPLDTPEPKPSYTPFTGQPESKPSDTPEPKPSDTPSTGQPESKPSGTASTGQPKNTPSDTNPSAKRKIDFAAEGTSSAINDTKHIRYKE